MGVFRRGDKFQPLIKRLSDEQIVVMAEVFADAEAAIVSLPEDEQRAYRDAQQSVIDARRAGERLARELWIG